MRPIVIIIHPPTIRNISQLINLLSLAEKNIVQEIHDHAWLFTQIFREFTFTTLLYEPTELLKNISRSSQWNNVLDLQVVVGEGGQQQPLFEVVAQLTDLVAQDPNTVLPAFSQQAELGDIPAGSSRGFTFQVEVPRATPVGDYTGQITVTSANAGEVVIPVTIQVDDSWGDITRDGLVDLPDILDFSEQWLASGEELSADVNQDGQVDLQDFADLAADWLWEASWYQSE